MVLLDIKVTVTYRLKVQEVVFDVVVAKTPLESPACCVECPRQRRVTRAFLKFHNRCIGNTLLL